MGRSRSNVIGQRFRTGARRGFDGLKVYSSQALPLVVVFRVLGSAGAGEEREYDYAEKYAHNENGEKQVSFGGHSAKHSKSSLYRNEGRGPGGGPRPHTSDLKAQAAARPFVKRAGRVGFFDSGVLAAITVEGWARDVTEDIAREARERSEGSVGKVTQEFLERVLGAKSRCARRY